MRHKQQLTIEVRDHRETGMFAVGMASALRTIDLLREAGDMMRYVDQIHYTYYWGPTGDFVIDFVVTVGTVRYSLGCRYDIGFDGKDLASKKVAREVLATLRKAYEEYKEDGLRRTIERASAILEPPPGLFMRAVRTLFARTSSPRSPVGTTA